MVANVHQLFEKRSEADKVLARCKATIEARFASARDREMALAGVSIAVTHIQDWIEHG